MKNIVLITPLYPIPSKENQVSYVCHYFAREWATMGYNVIVIHLQPVHCWLWHLIEKITNHKGCPVSYAERLNETEHYVMDNVPVYRIPVYQLIPRIDASNSVIRLFTKEIEEILHSENFKPDIVVGHCMSPHIIPIINEELHAKTVMVTHGGDASILKKKFDNWEQIVDSYDAWGFRSVPKKKQFEASLKKVDNSFICYSGIPERYITTVNKHSFTKPISNFIFVGELLERKYPLQVFDALQKVFPTGYYKLTYVGEGALMGKLKQKVEKEDLYDNVSILGQMSRDEIMGYYDEADYMVMISRGEAFALVYLEAMARGCITIASRGEGIDGVIVNGKNGFLCKAGDTEELIAIIKHINSLSVEEKRAISENAIETAKSLTDYKAAKKYIDFLEKL